MALGFLRSLDRGRGSPTDRFNLLAGDLPAQALTRQGPEAPQRNWQHRSTHRVREQWTQIANHMQRAFIRPFKFLGTQPIVQILALYMAYLFGVLYLILSTFPLLWTERYHESIGIGGLNYISLALGLLIGCQIAGPLIDIVYRRLKYRNNGEGRPEFRIPLMAPGAILLPCGIFLYGWSAQYHTHWIVPNIGTALFGAGVVIGFQCIQTYLIDGYTMFAASALAGATVLRSCAGFGFPLFAPYMYEKLDYGWGNSVLGFIAIGIGLPAPMLLWIYGQRLRSRARANPVAY